MESERTPTLPELLLKLDASEKSGGDPSCHNRSLSTTQVLGAVEQGRQGVSTRWTERWTVDRCGVLVPYLVKFARAEDGDLDVTMQLESPAPNTAALPGSTIADPVLQRDAVGFLALRDFSASVAEGTCNSRQVIDTQLIQPLEGAVLEGNRPVGGKWVERWTLARCGVPVRYLVRFTTTPKGTTFTVEHEP